MARPAFAAWLAAAGHIPGWDGFGLEGAGHTYAVVLSVNSVSGRATVAGDRRGLVRGAAGDVSPIAGD